MIQKFLVAMALVIPLSAGADSNVRTTAPAGQAAATTAPGRLDKAVLFDYGTTRVRSAGRSTLAAVARRWRANVVPMKITVEGHGHALLEEASIELGYLRAARVRERLIAEGVDPAFIEAVGHSRAEIGRYVDLVFSLTDDRAK